MLSLTWPYSSLLVMALGLMISVWHLSPRMVKPAARISHTLDLATPVSPMMNTECRTSISSWN